MFNLRFNKQHTLVEITLPILLSAPYLPTISARSRYGDILRFVMSAIKSFHVRLVVRIFI